MRISGAADGVGREVWFGAERFGVRVEAASIPSEDERAHGRRTSFSRGKNTFVSVHVARFTITRRYRNVRLKLCASETRTMTRRR